MSKIFYLMGKSASGKDRVYRELLRCFSFEKIVLYTTRPMRQGETHGIQYYFTDKEEYKRLCAVGKVIEARSYQTVHGEWIYYTVDDGTIHPEGNAQYLMIGTLESYAKMKEYFGEKMLVPIYLEVEDGLRLERALKREQQETNPRYQEMCRRYLADEEDFSEEKLQAAGIKRRFRNEQLELCLKEIVEYIRGRMTSDCTNSNCTDIK